jgi:hypothetical protein
MEAPATQMMELNHHGERFKGTESYAHPKLIEFDPVCHPRLEVVYLGWKSPALEIDIGGFYGVALFLPRMFTVVP